MKQTQLADLLNTPFNHTIEQAMNAGNIPVGYTCSYVPRVLLSLKGLIPVRVRAPGTCDTDVADIYLSSVTCTYTRSLLEAAINGEYDFLGGWFFATGCDHIRRLMDNLDYLNKPFTHIIDVPHRTGEAALDWYLDELKSLCSVIENQFQVDTSDDALRCAIRTHNRVCSALGTIGDTRKHRSPPLSGTEFQQIMLASLVTPSEQLIPMLEDIIETMTHPPCTRTYKARLMVVGGCLDDTGLISLIESMGGLVVADRFCTGSIPGITPIPEDADPIKAIAEHTFQSTECPRMMEDYRKRLDRILAIRDQFDVDGIILENLKFCDLWGIDTGLLATSLKNEGVSVLKLERDYRLNNDGQLRTRIQAFLESIRNDSNEPHI